jgi:hypothetical protein
VCQEETPAPQQTDALFDHLVGPGEQRCRHREVERLSGPEVAHQLDFGGMLDREIVGLCALENCVASTCLEPPSEKSIRFRARLNPLETL